MPRGHRRKCTLKKTNRKNVKRKKHPHYSATKKTRVTKNALKRWAALLRETQTQLRKESWRQWTQLTTKRALTGLTTTLMQTLESTDYRIRKTLINTLQGCTDIWRRILTELVEAGTKMGSFNRGEVKWRHDNRYRTHESGKNIPTRGDGKMGTRWETDPEEHTPHLTDTLLEIGEDWGPHKPTTKKRAARKKWNNHSATKRMITTIEKITKMKEVEKRLKPQVRIPEAGRTLQTLTHLLRERKDPQEGRNDHTDVERRNTTPDKHETPLRQQDRVRMERIKEWEGTRTRPPETLIHLARGGTSPQERRRNHTATTGMNSETEVTKTPLRQKYRTKGEESNGKKGTCTQPPETLAHLVGGAQTKRNIWETTEVYGVALSGREGTTQEYLWDEQILAALYLADRTQPPIQYPQPHEKFIRIMEGIGDINAERRDGASHRRAGLGASHSMRTIRNEGGRQIYVVNNHLHWRLIMMDSSKKQVWAFDPMGNKFTEREKDVIGQAFPGTDSRT